MLDFADQPYQYFPPRYSWLVTALVRQVNRLHFLPRAAKVRSVTVQGREQLLDSLKPRDRLLLLPNHPTHADAPILLETVRQLGLSTQIMAAYDVFIRSRLDGWIMQRIGAFSVDREQTDQQAMKQAMATLIEGRRALTIFPEGNVYLQNDEVTEFNQGAAFLALRAARTLGEQKAIGRVVAVPISIKATQASDVRLPVTQTLASLANAFGCQLEVGCPPVQALRTVGTAALRRNLQHRGIDCPEGDELRLLIEGAAGAVLDRLEQKLGLPARPTDGIVERVRRTRRVIHEVRTDPARAVDHAAAASWADEAMLAFRIASYSGGYVARKPTLDRVSETTEKLYEDGYRRTLPPFGQRHAIVRIGSPIDLSELVSEGRSRQAVSDLTQRVEQAVQAGLDAINANNPHPGGELWNR